LKTSGSPVGRIPLLRSKALAALLAVAVQGVEDDGMSFCRGANFIYLDGFALRWWVRIRSSDVQLQRGSPQGAQGYTE
jgi:hypothetical protein